MNLLVQTNEGSELHVQFLEVLKPIKQSLPLKSFMIWETELNKPAPDKVKFEQLYALLLQHLENNQQDSAAGGREWTDAVSFITLYIIAAKTEPYPLSWLDSFSGNVNPANVALDKLTTLYNCWQNIEQMPFAGFYAFYLLVKSILNDPDIRHNLDINPNYEEIQDYLQLISKSKKDSAFTNKLTDFLIAYNQNSSISARHEYSEDHSYARKFDGERISHLKKVDIDKINIGKIITKERPIKVLIVGDTGSGKTTFFKSFYLSLLEKYMGNYPVIKLTLTGMPGNEDLNEWNSYRMEGLPTPNHSRYWELSGELRLNNEDYQLAVLDTRGGMISGKIAPYPYHVPKTADREKQDHDKSNVSLEESMVDADWVILVLDPDSIFSKKQSDDIYNNIVECCKYLYHESKHALLSIVVSKFDEYGAVISGPRALVQNQSQGLSLTSFATSGDDEHLNKFISDTAALFDHDATRHVVSALLHKLKRYFIHQLQDNRLPLINTYLLSVNINSLQSPSADEFYKTGEPQVFLDFAHYMEYLLSQSKDIAPEPARNAKITYLADSNMLKIDWLDSNSAGVTFTVKRIDDGKEELINADIRSANGEGTCIDDTVKKGRRYTYRITTIVDKTQRSISTDIVASTPPASAQNLSINATKNDQDKISSLEINWDNIKADYEVRYKIARTIKDPPEWIVLNDKLNADKYLDQNVKRGKVHRYKITAIASEQNLQSRPEYVSYHVDPINYWRIIFIFLIFLSLFIMICFLFYKLNNP